jgi:L-2,4-diaminobutyric acid acetyltransferase
MPTSNLARQKAVGSPAARLRKPRASDGAAVHALVAACPPLDPNSLYCNLLQCTHFAQTSALAESGDAVVGFVSGYRPPTHPDSLFVWQVAVSGAARGQGLGKRLMLDILTRPENRDVRYLRTTITGENAPSWAMFESLARQLGATAERHLLFDADRHFAGRHDSEHEFIIGPFDTARIPH